MARLLCGVIALLFLLVALFPLPTTTPLHADPAGAYDYYLSSVLSESAGNATPTPTVVPTNTPSGVVRVLDNHSWYFNDQLDDYFVVGEVENGTGAPVQLVNVRITFYNSNNSPTYSDTTFVKGEQLLPGEKACFLLLDDGIPDGWATYRFTNVSYFPYEDNVPNLTVSGVSGEVVPYQTYEEYELRGTVRNPNASEVVIAEMVGTLYNAEGKVVDCGSIWEYDMSPGEMESFLIEYSFRTAYSGAVDSFRLLPTGGYELRMPDSPEVEAAYQEYRAERERETERQPR